MAFQINVALLAVIADTVNPEGTRQVDVAPSVVNVADEEYADEPDAQILCTWNSYVVDIANPEITFGMKEEEVVVHIEENVGLYLML